MRWARRGCSLLAWIRIFKWRRDFGSRVSPLHVLGIEVAHCTHYPPVQFLLRKDRHAMEQFASVGWKSALGRRALPPADTSATEAASSIPVSRMKTILFADDKKNIREYCRASLEDEGYRVVLARDGAEALQTYRAECPDLAILDLSMPRVGGMEALERIKKLAPDFPVILFTANDDDCLRDQRAVLAEACVEKSNDLGDLKRIVASTLQKSRSEPGDARLRLGLPPLRKEAGCP